jgi:hypothetical protein
MVVAGMLASFTKKTDAILGHVASRGDRFPVDANSPRIFYLSSGISEGAFDTGARFDLT